MRTLARRVLSDAEASSGAGFYAAENLLKAFSKSPNSLRSNSEFLKNNADFHQPRISTPPAEPSSDSTRLASWYFQPEGVSN